MGLPHTATIITFQPLAGAMISTLRTTQDTITILIFIADAIRIQVPIVTVVCGLEAITSAQMS